MKHIPIRIDAPSGKPLLFDLHFPEQITTPPPVAVFFHGFKGFKDWGYWHLAGDAFAAAGVAFLRCNFSLNGVTPEHPQDFGDLEAFGRNTYSAELADIDAVLNWIHLPGTQAAWPMDTGRLTLIGHSRGGGLAVIAAAEDARIQRLTTWAAVDRLDFLWHNKSDLLRQWKSDGVFYIHNARTHQDMPLYFQLYEDFVQHARRFDLQAALRNFSKPMLILHGSADTSVPPQAARNLKQWNPAAQLHLIEGADHVFGGRHPYPDNRLPAPAAELAEWSIRACLA